MKLAAAVIMAGLGVNFAAGQTVRDGSRVIVCLQDTTHMAVRNQAAGMASRMYAAISVTLLWRYGARDCKATGVIQIEMTDATPKNLLPEALAYALPIEGIHIRIFLDRLENIAGERAAPYLLAHVMVHEIGHILEGMSRHSESGVMKARFTRDDDSRMMVGFLPFDPEDVILIHKGVESRSLMAANR